MIALREASRRPAGATSARWRRRCATAARTSSALYRDARAGLAHARLSIIDLATRPAAAVERGRHALGRLQRRDLQLRRAARRAARARAIGSARRATPRSSSTPTRPGATTRSRASTASSRSRCGTRRARTLVLARDPRRRAPALPVRARRPALLRERGEGDLRRRPAIPRALDPVGLGETFTFWTAVAARSRVPRGRRSSAGARADVSRGGRPRARVLGSRATRRWRHGAFARLARGRGGARSATRSRRRRGCACCAPTCRSAATSRAASTARSSRRSACRAKGEQVPARSRCASRTPSTTRPPSSARWPRASAATTARSSCAARDIAARLPDGRPPHRAPILRTAPAPLFLLSQLVRERGHQGGAHRRGRRRDVRRLRPLPRGEGAPVLGAAARTRRSRPRLLERLYPYLARSPVAQRAMARQFFGRDLERLDAAGLLARAALAEHARRSSGCSRRTLRASVARRRRRRASCSRRCPPSSRAGRRLAQDQYLEVRTLLSGYLLSSQGDRMLMAHSVEGRFPFLDPDVVGAGELAARRPTSCACSTRSTC